MVESASDIGQFLRAARNRCDPAAFDFPRGKRRRVPGLRREEVAELLGISSVWYARFEGGRGRMSLKLVQRLADLLMLSDAERRTLLALALHEFREVLGDESARNRAERRCVRVGMFDLPVAQNIMLRGTLAIATTKGLSMEHVARSWIVQSELLERGEIDVAITYRMGDEPTPTNLEDVDFGEEVGSHAVVSNALGFRPGALCASDLRPATLHAPVGRLGAELRSVASAAGLEFARCDEIDSNEALLHGLASGAGFGLVTDDYARVMREIGLDVRPIRNFGITSRLVLRHRRDDPNPALRRFIEAAVS